MGTPQTLTLPAASSPEANAALTEMLRALQDALRVAPQAAPTPALPREAREALARALVAHDAYVAVVRASTPMSCAAGCVACCHDNPRGVSGGEIDLLAAAVAALPDGAAVFAAFAASARDPLPADAHRAARRPCPLLRGGLCALYAARPVACRAFHAITPAAFCDPAHPSYADRMNPHLDPPAVLVQALRVLAARHGLPPSIDLHAGMAAYA